MFNKIIVIIGVADNKIIARAYYRYTSYFLVSCVFDFKSYEYSKHLFSRVGEKLAEDLFLESKRVGIDLPNDLTLCNGFQPNIELWAGFDLLRIFPREEFKGVKKFLNEDELENFCSAFHRGLKKGFQTLCIDPTGELLFKFVKEFAEKQSY